MTMCKLEWSTSCSTWKKRENILDPIQEVAEITRNRIGMEHVI